MRDSTKENANHISLIPSNFWERNHRFPYGQMALMFLMKIMSLWPQMGISVSQKIPVLR